MPEVAAGPAATQSTRFRTTRYPGFFSGTTDPATGNIIPQTPIANPNAATVDPALTRPTSGLSGVPPLPEPAPSPPGIGEAAVSAAIPFATSTIGTGAGTFLAANPAATAGEALGAGVGHLGKTVSEFAGSIGLGSGAGEAAAAAGAQAAGPAAGAATGSLGAVSGGEIGGAIVDVGSLGTGAGIPVAPAAGASAAPAAGEAASSLPGIGGAIGAGLGTFAVGLLTGQDPAQALKSGALSGIGFFIGNAIAPGVGGFIGSLIGSIFGGRVICTELMKKGLIDRDLWAIDMEHARTRMNESVIRGYHYWAIPYVNLMKPDDWIGRVAVRIAIPLATWRAEEIAFVMGRRRHSNLKGMVVRAIGESVCWLIGQLVGDVKVGPQFKEAV